jgi:FtsP/CotA-like multicopper oxidase with cupredoxin domain
VKAMVNSYGPYLPLIGIGALALALLIGAAAVLIFNIQPQMAVSNPSKMQTETIILYEGELSNGKFGFGTAPNNLTSPGPTIRFSTSDTINITVVNVGKLTHAFAITATLTGGPVLFNAMVGSASKPLMPGQAGSVICRPYNAAFDYWYTSPVSGDVAAGMYGAVIVSSVTGPAYP